MNYLESSADHVMVDLVRKKFVKETMLDLEKLQKANLTSVIPLLLYFLEKRMDLDNVTLRDFE